MPAAYHIDLRRKVIQSIENGMRISEASRIFGVSRNSIYLWFKRQEASNSLEAATGYHNPHNRQIKDLQAFASFMSSRKDWTQREIGEALGVSAKVVGRALKKLGWTRKKRLMVTKNEMKSNEKLIERN